MRPYQNIAIALMSTGDEVVAGDIINKNAHEMAHRLERQRFYVASHLAVRDDIEDLTVSLKWLHSQHKVVIMTGGLGPTVDDRTIDAVAAVLGLPVEFNEAAWAYIQQIYAKMGRQAPEVAKRMARFVAGSHTIKPTQGTAYGSIVTHKGTITVMLPGPPSQCIPMLETDVMPYLLDQQLNQWLYRQTYYLFNVAESHVATLIEPIADNLGIQLGFRASYPYLEVKCFIQQPDVDLSALKTVLSPWLLADKKLPIEDVFLAYWAKHGQEWSLTVKGADHWLEWLPGWSKQHGTKELVVRYEAEPRKLYTLIDQHETMLHIPVGFPENLQQQLVKGWLCHQWAQTLGLL